MLVTTNICDQIIARPLGGSFCAKELRAHVVIDPNNARALLCESLDRFRTDQSRRSRDDGCAYDVDPSAIRAARVMRKLEHRLPACGADGRLAC
jgi:hypothetical protein